MINCMCVMYNIILLSFKSNCLLDNFLLGGGLDFSVSGDTPVDALVSLVRLKRSLFSATIASLLYCEIPVGLL